MVGNNVFEFNEATMQKIVEYYLNNVMFGSGQDSVTVTSVTQTTGMTPVFRVRLEEEKAQ